MRLIAWFVVILQLVRLTFNLNAGDIYFTEKPAISVSAAGTNIVFAASTNTDAAVHIEDTAGVVVRHLAAGVLGPNAPAPFKSNTLKQEIAWDGKDDDGNAATGEVFRVRVGLGLKASYAGQAFTEKEHTGPNRLEPVCGMVTGADGRLYVLERCMSTVWNGTKIVVFLRDGSYEKTIQPYPSNLPVDDAKRAGVFLNSYGGFNPLVHHPSAFAFYPVENVIHQPAITPAGQLILAGLSTSDRRGMHPGSNLHLASITTSGAVAFETYAGPPLGGGLRYGPYPVLVVSSDSRTVYISGFKSTAKGATAVFCAPLPERGPAQVWYGDPAAAGSDGTHFDDIRGMTVDGKGHLFVSDFGNNRVLVMNESDRTVAGAFDVQKPEGLASHSRSSSLYVQSGSLLLKYRLPAGPGPVDWSKTSETARLDLAGPGYRPGVWRFAVDGCADVPVVWLARNDRLTRCEDTGAGFTVPSPAGCFPAKLFWRPTADPYRREVLCKTTDGQYQTSVRILNEKTGEIVIVPGGNGRNGIGGLEGREHRLGPDGTIYAQDHAFGAGGVIHFDRNGKQMPFEGTVNDPLLRGRLPEGANGNSQWERDFTVDRKGDIYVKGRGPEYHGLMTVHVYGPDGRLKRIPLQMVSDGMYGPRVDPAGNIYILEAVKEPGVPFPKEFADRMANQRMSYEYDWMYGSVIKFSPLGGSVWFTDRLASPLTYEGWGSEASVKGLHTTGGALVGTIAKAPAVLTFPNIRLDSATASAITIRLKNDSSGTKATLRYHRLDEGYMESCGPGMAKVIDIVPWSDFTDYTFDMSGEKAWNGHKLLHLFLTPTDAKEGAFSIDRIGVCGTNGTAAGVRQTNQVWNFDAEDGPDSKLPAGLRKEHVGAFSRAGGATLEGALWCRSGFSPVGDMGLMDGSYCHCTGTDFDVDDFGRVFAPDACRFRIGVLDANGNSIMSFGGYGTQDNCGPDSYVVDQAGKFLRPRKTDDPPDLVSPFAEPELAFGWIVGMAVTDRYLYVDDVISKRVLRVGLGYAAQEVTNLSVRR